MNLFLQKRKEYLVFMVVFLIALSFAFYTKHVWEDWYITYRCSKNLALGNGLVYQIGQRVHAFTSPIGTLIPAMLSIITLNSSDEQVIWLFRIIGCFLLGLSAILLFRIAKKYSFCLFTTIFLIGMFGTNIKIIDFSINGMETAFMIFFLACVIYFMSAPTRYLSLKLGIAWTGLMWTRPDSFIYIGSLSIGYLLFNPRVADKYSRKELIKTYLKAGIILIALYSPWIIWAWSYYGSAVPNTITSKGLRIIPYIKKEPGIYFAWHVIKYNFILKLSTFYYTFMPAYFEMGGWDNLAFIYSKPLSLLSSLYWALPFVNPAARAISFAVLLAHIYLSYIVTWIAPWYLPSITFLSIIVLSQIIQEALNLSLCLNSKKINILKNIIKPSQIFIKLYATLIFAIGLSLTLNSAYQLRIQQKIIETGSRKNIGLWLNKNAASNKDTVFLEPLGYIGFFSQLKMYDAVGLCSQEVVAARQKKARNDFFGNLILELQPDWLVLRPNEIHGIQHENPTLLTKNYQAAKIFDVSKEIQSYPFIAGKNYLLCDQTFTIFKKRRQSALKN